MCIEMSCFAYTKNELKLGMAIHISRVAKNVKFHLNITREEIGHVMWQAIICIKCHIV